jgi:predicted nucleotidyltransferase
MSGKRTSVKSALAELFSKSAPPGVVAAYLFGAHAAGRAHADSDVDVGVLLQRTIFPEERDRFAERIRLSAWIGAALGEPLVDVVILNDAPPTLAAAIVGSDELLYCSDEETEHAFRRDSMIRAAEIAPFIRKFREIKLHALAR